MLAAPMFTRTVHQHEARTVEQWLRVAQRNGHVIETDQCVETMLIADVRCRVFLGFCTGVSKLTITIKRVALLVGFLLVLRCGLRFPWE